MRREIQTTLSGQSNLCRVYGFGSFFRGTAYNDIDILLVSKASSLSPLSDYYMAKSTLELLSTKIGVKIDITFLTYSEFLDNPLLEMDRLTTIIEND